MHIRRETVRYFCRVEFDGGDFCGWQVQPDRMSVQGEIEKAIYRIIRQECRVTGAGRTDAGVHAKNMGAHFDLDEAGREITQRSLNAVLPDTVSIKGLQRVGEDFHARYSAVERHYRYHFSYSKQPLFNNKVYRLRPGVDWERFRRILSELEGRLDCTSFCSSGSETENMVCDIKETYIYEENGLWIMGIKADRFLYKMVRTLAGTILDITRGNLKQEIMDVIEARDRRSAGHTAPAKALVLESVEYPEGIVR